MPAGVHGVEEGGKQCSSTKEQVKWQGEEEKPPISCGKSKVMAGDVAFLPPARPPTYDLTHAQCRTHRSNRPRGLAKLPILPAPTMERRTAAGFSRGLRTQRELEAGVAMFVIACQRPHSVAHVVELCHNSPETQAGNS
uniref:Uncharacterized protein n=1 Tax=Sphaerodactylus townsendi TaxID=933632 RepID=A0ACB8G3F7_9SAUR